MNGCITRGYIMKGYSTSAGYMGYVSGSYILFASEDEYEDYICDAA